MGEITGLGSAKQYIMHVLDETGDTKIMWNPRDDDEVQNARESFSKLLGKGFRAFRVQPDGAAGERMYEFDRRAEKIIFVPQLAGGDLRYEEPPVVVETIPRHAQVLLDAADYIDEWGWIQNAYINANGVCAVQAINAAAVMQTITSSPRMTATLPAKQALENLIGGWNIENWNDVPGRTKEEVTQAMRRAARMVIQRA